MSDTDVANIERTLGVLLERTETQGKQVAEIHADIAILKAHGCAKGQERQTTIDALRSDMDRIKGIGKKAILAVVGVAIGSVGIKESLTALLKVISGGE